MLYANCDGRTKVRATPGAKGQCPDCQAEVIAKCGMINAWHWAHAQEWCDYWGEPETKWHVDWKLSFPADWVEVGIGKNGVKHRADILTPSGVVIELQHSFLDPVQIAEREEFYGRMLWLFDVQEPFLNDRLLLRNRGSYYTFRWKHPRKSLAYTTRPTIWHIHPLLLLHVKKMHLSEKCGGWGRIVKRSDFLRNVLDSEVEE